MDRLLRGRENISLRRLGGKRIYQRALLRLQVGVALGGTVGFGDDRGVLRLMKTRVQTPKLNATSFGLG